MFCNGKLLNPYVALASIVSTLEEVKEAPESSLYLPFMGQLHVDEFQEILACCVRMKICKVENHLITFTAPPKDSSGEKLLVEVKKIYEKAKA